MVNTEAIKLKTDGIMKALLLKTLESRSIAEVAKDKTLPAMLRVKAINMLGASGDTKAIEVLEECLRDKNPVVSSWAQSALSTLKEAPEDGFEIDTVIKIPTPEARVQIKRLESLATRVRLGQYPPETIAVIAQLREADHKKTTELSEFLTPADRDTLSKLGLLEDENKIKHAASEAFPEWVVKATGLDKIPPAEIENLVIWLTAEAEQFRKFESDKSQAARLLRYSDRKGFHAVLHEKLKDNPAALDRLQRVLQYLKEEDRNILEKYGYCDISKEPPPILEKEDIDLCEKLGL